MQTYIGTKIVAAEPMDEAVACFQGLIRGGQVVEIHGDGTGRPGYRVVYEDGYESWSPADVFERCYRQVTVAEAGLVASGDIGVR